MSLKKLLAIPLVLSAILFIYFSSDLYHSAATVLRSLHGPRLIIVLLLSAVLQIAGHLVRAQKMRLLLEPVKLSTRRFQFRALSVGYLFNAVLPFRIGELLRGQIIASAENISFGFALTLVIIERAIDALVLGAVGLLLFIPVGLATGATITYALLLLLLAALIGLAIATAVRQDIKLFRLWYAITGWFNPNIRNSLRFKAWSIVYGLQQVLTRKRMARYSGLTIVSWTLYGLSILILAQFLFPHMALSHKLGLSASPYYGISVPAGPANLGGYSQIANAYTRHVNISPDQHLVFNLLSWAVLIVPISLCGVVFFFLKTKETLWRRRPYSASVSSLTNKLLRTEDISQDMAKFLENYFSGNSLSRIVHRMELKDNFRLLKYFKGGSDAITILALQNGQEVVKKIIPLQFEDRLKAQYDWLRAHANKQGMVKALGEQRTKEYYAIDLEYDAANEMLYEFIHRNPLAESKQVLDDVWKTLFAGVYKKLGKLAPHSRARKQYIDKHIFGCLEKAAVVEPELIRAAEPPTLVINGKEYDNLYQVMDKIKANKQAWQDIANYREASTVHGDVIVDNLLVSKKTNKVLIIDPAPDGNIIQGPVFDFGKNLQSLYCGYESLLRDEEPVYLTDGNVINYQDQSSAKYTKLASYVRGDLSKRHLTESEQRAMLFHAAALFIRRLKHQVYYTPVNVLKFYAVGVKTLNDFLAQYPQDDAR